MEGVLAAKAECGSGAPGCDSLDKQGYFGSFPLTVTVTTMGYRSYKNPLNKAPLRTVTGRGNDPKDTEDNVENCHRDITSTVENQIEKNLENGMESGTMYTMPSLVVFSQNSDSRVRGLAIAMTKWEGLFTDTWNMEFRFLGKQE